MSALDELREAIGLVDGLRLAGTCLSRASVGERTRALVARRSALAAVEAEREELDHILASVDVPHALNGRMQPLAMRARAFVARSNRLAAVEAELAALRETKEQGAADTARLDFLLRHRFETTTWPDHAKIDVEELGEESFTGPNLRAALDAARAAEPEGTP